MTHRKILPAILTLLFMLSFIPITKAQRIPPPLPKKAPHLLVEDLRILRSLLEKHHPSLYWYTSRDSMDLYFDASIAGITDSLNEVEFKNHVSKLIAHIRCGHTSVRFSRAYMKVAQRYRYPQFPLSLKVWDDSLVVLASAYRNDSILKRGTVVTAINGRSPEQLVTPLYQYISTDGYSENHKSQLLSSNFPGWYKTIYGDSDSVYQIQYLDDTGQTQLTDRKAYTPVVDTSARRGVARPQPPRLTRREIRKLNLLSKRSLSIDTLSRTAFMRLTTFTGGRLKAFFRRSFKTMKKLGIEDLVIDLRENGGGRVSNSIRLTQYLSDTPFKIGDTVMANGRSLPPAKYMRSKILYWFAMRFAGTRMEDGRIHYRRYERHVFSPRSRHHFEGRLYVLQGGYTFSAATMFIAQVQGQEHVRVLGEETGGGNYGNSAMFIPKLVLPNSKLEVSMPLYRLVIDSTRKKGGGILPDIEVKPSSYAIQQGFDVKVREALRLIDERRKEATNRSLQPGPGSRAGQ